MLKILTKIDVLQNESELLEDISFNKGSYKCTFCDKTYVSQRGLSKHLKTKHHQQE